MDHEERRTVQARRTTQPGNGVQARPALAGAQALLGPRLALSRVRGEGSEHRRHCGGVWGARRGDLALAQEARHTAPLSLRSAGVETLGRGGQRQSDVEPAGRTQPAMARRRDTGAPSVLHESGMEGRLLIRVEARQGDVSTLRSLPRRSTRHADARPSHRLVCDQGTPVRSLQPRVALRGLPSVCSFTEEH